MAEEESGEIVIWSRYDLSDTENSNSVALNERIKVFEAETGITVVYEQIAWDQLSPKLALAVQSGGNVPDVVEIGSQHVPALMDAGALMGLNDLLADEAWVGELTEGDNLACVIDGERRCVAHNVRGGMTYYRMDQFPDGFPATQDAALEMAAQKKEADLYFNTFYAGRSYAAIEIAWWPHIHSNGGNIFDAEGKPVWSTPEVVEVVEWSRKLYTQGYLPEVAVTGDFADAESVWLDDASAAFGGGSWSAIFVPGLQDAVDAGKVGVTGGLSFNGGDPYVFLVSEGWAVPNGANNPTGARAWLRGYMEPSFLASWAEAQYGIPTTSAAYEAGQFDSAFYSQVDEILGTQGLYMQQSPYYVESLDSLAIAWQELLLDPELDAAAHLQEAQDEVLARYWE
ncbi:MAG: extracellular solute-binding protein [Chloroflexi bacterium]|nr:MAG: extracellular solute-binding protein [Chloroflexota bacterium]